MAAGGGAAGALPMADGVNAGGGTVGVNVAVVNVGVSDGVLLGLGGSVAVAEGVIVGGRRDGVAVIVVGVALSGVLLGLGCGLLCVVVIEAVAVGTTDGVPVPTVGSIVGDGVILSCGCEVI